jgi:WhiB family redox-sensing transcriptional regulator
MDEDYGMKAQRAGELRLGVMDKRIVPGAHCSDVHPICGQCGFPTRRRDQPSADHPGTHVRANATTCGTCAFRRYHAAEKRFKASTTLTPVVMAGPVTVLTWRFRAACVGDDPEIFYPDKIGSKRLKFEAAKAICDVCPAVAFCLAAALDDERGELGVHRWGMRGGLRPAERVRLDPPARLGERAHPHVR